MYILKFIFKTQRRILKTNIKYILIYKFTKLFTHISSLKFEIYATFHFILLSLSFYPYLPFHAILRKLALIVDFVNFFEIFHLKHHKSGFIIFTLFHILCFLMTSF